MDDVNDVVPGMKVKIVSLNGTDGMFVHKKHLALRKVGAIGTVLLYVAGHGGDVWWIKQDDGIAAYGFREFEPA